MNDTIPMTVNVPAGIAPLIQAFLGNVAPAIHNQPAGALQPPPDAPATMLEAYQRLIASERAKHAEANTIRDHCGAMRAFDDWYKHRLVPSLSADAQTGLITQLAENKTIVWEFARYRLAESGNSLATVVRRLTQLKMVLRVAVDQKLIPDMPEIPSQKDLRRVRTEVQRSQGSLGACRDRPATAVPIEDCNLLYRHADAASWPQLGSVSASDFWRGVIRWHALWGPRTQDIFSYRNSRKPGLIWSDVHDECPDEELPDTSPHGWIEYQIGKAATKENSYLLLPLPKWQREFIERFRGLDPVRVFPIRWNHRRWGIAWNQIRESAGVGQNVYLSMGKGNTKAMRKTAARWWLQTTGLDPVAQYLLHHSEVTTARKHYLSTRAQVIPLLLEYMDSFPLSDN